MLVVSRGEDIFLSSITSSTKARTSVARNPKDSIKWDTDLIKVYEKVRQPCLLNTEELQFFDEEKVLGATNRKTVQRD